MGSIKQLKDNAGQKFYPVSNTNSTIYKNGYLEDAIILIEKRIKSMGQDPDYNNDFNDDF